MGTCRDLWGMWRRRCERVKAEERISVLESSSFSFVDSSSSGERMDDVLRAARGDVGSGVGGGWWVHSQSLVVSWVSSSVVVVLDGVLHLLGSMDGAYLWRGFWSVVICTMRAGADDVAPCEHDEGRKL